MKILSKLHLFLAGKMSFIIVLFIISLSNFWIYRIYQANFFLGEVLVIETILLYLSILPYNKMVIKFLTFSILIMLSVFFLIYNFDKNLLSSPDLDVIKINQRRSFLFSELGEANHHNILGKVYFNKSSLFLNNIQKNLFSSLDWNIYFSQTSLIDDGKYNLLLGPIFILGLIYILVNSKKIITLYFFTALIVTTFINLDGNLGPLLLFPFINLCIVLGFIYLIRLIKATKIYK